MISYIGVDIAKRTFTAAVKTKKGTHTKGFRNEPEGYKQMLRWVEKLAGKSKHCFIMEATSTYYLPCALFLNSWGKKVAVVNPRYVHDFANAMGYKNKTDLSDAQVLAHFGEVKQSAYWQPPTKKIVQLRGLVKRREELVGMLVQERNRIQTPMLTEAQQKSLKKIITVLKQERDEIERELKKMVNADQKLRKTVDLLTSIKGVGFIVAVTLISIVGDIKLFKNKRAFHSYLGVSPRQYSSGTSVHWSQMSKQGLPAARRCLFMASRVGARYEPIFQEYVESLIKRGKSYKRAIAALMRKLAGIIYAVWSNETPFSAETYRKIQARFQSSS